MRALLTCTNSSFDPYRSLPLTVGRPYRRYRSRASCAGGCWASRPRAAGAWQASQTVLDSLPGPLQEVVNVDLVAEDGLDLLHCLLVPEWSSSWPPCLGRLEASLRDRLRRTFDQVAIRKDSATAWNLAGGQVGLGQLPERLSIPRPRP
jgi:hypothetical protein